MKPIRIIEKLNEAYNYIGKDTGESGTHNNTHIEHIYTVRDQYGDIEDFKTREEAQAFIDSQVYDENDPEGYPEKPEYEIVEDDVEVSNKRIIVHDDLEESAESGLKTWCGIPDTIYRYHGDWSDPEVEYKGYLYNEWDLQDYLGDYFSDYLTDNKMYVDPEHWHNKFIEWVGNNADYVYEALETLEPQGITDEGAEELFKTEQFSDVLDILLNYKYIEKETYDKYMYMYQNAETQEDIDEYKEDFVENVLDRWY